ncbi:uncharacterized protein [Panulirus ornatus]|uniref:uncharacterized protein n=1 Tax=Panulirus ornatus TaxID=150431 RepID=UPI003A837282
MRLEVQLSGVAGVMMLALQLVAAAAVFLSVATAQMSVILDDTSRTLDQWTSDEDTSGRESMATGPLLGLLQSHHQEYEGSSSGDFVDPSDYPSPDTNFHPEGDLDPGDPTENGDYDEDDEDDDYENDLDLDSEEDEDVSKETQANNGRVKRKIMLGGGGSYSGVSRRRGGGDPYGRRRDNHNYHGPDYGSYYDSWPYRDRTDFDYSSTYSTAQTTSSSSALGSSASDNSNSGVVYGTPVGSSASSITGTSRSSGVPRSYGNVRSSLIEPDVPSTSGRKSKTGRREIKKKMSKILKWEIAEYAIKHGTHRAAEHYAEIVDRRLTPKKIEKFVNRYQKRRQKTQKRKM